MNVKELDVVRLKNGKEGVVLEVFKADPARDVEPAVMLELVENIKPYPVEPYDLPIVPMTDIDEVIEVFKG